MEPSDWQAQRKLTTSQQLPKLPRSFSLAKKSSESFPPISPSLAARNLHYFRLKSGRSAMIVNPAVTFDTKQTHISVTYQCTSAEG